ncbi:MAG: OB-fold putative lipoprotein [Bacteroidales bacterium]|nr:OB-fold putative lipoprotein [Bacteroidales bacterium]
MKKLLIILLVLLVVAAAAAFYVYKYIYNKPHPDFEQVESELSVRAKRLWTDYSMNKEIADGNYTDKMLEIEGTIMRVEEVDDMVIVVFAFRHGDFGDEGIRVTMLPQFHQAAKGIDPFKPVKIKGLCTGYNGIDVIVENGSIVGSQ